jgi:hypothetical protein
MPLSELGIGALEGFACDILGHDELSEIHDRIQERRTTWTAFKEHGLANFLEETCRESLPHELPLRQTKLNHTSSPIVEIGLLIMKFQKATGQSLMPVTNSRVMTSVATAGSWQQGEFKLLFDVLGLQYQCETFKTGLHGRICGRNGRMIPKTDVCVEYDQNASKDTWSVVSEGLYDQLVEKSTFEKGSVNAIFHWGCTSHNETFAPNNKAVVEGWAWHEHWNVLYCIAMARHALDFLAPGGRLVLKVRVFEQAETLGLMSLLSCAFKEFHVFPNSHQLCEFGIVVGSGFLGSGHKTVQKVKASLKCNTSYRLDCIMSDDLVTEKNFRSTLKNTVAVRQQMRCDHDYVNLITLQIIYHIQQCLTNRSSRFPYDQIQQSLQELSDMDPIPVDAQWIPDICRRIESFISKNQTSISIQNSLSVFVKQWKLEKFSVPDGNINIVHHEDRLSHRHTTTKLRSLLDQLKLHAVLE